jgi:hypothetical protein
MREEVDSSMPLLEADGAAAARQDWRGVGRHLYNAGPR